MKIDGGRFAWPPVFYKEHLATNNEDVQSVPAMCVVHKTITGPGLDGA